MGAKRKAAKKVATSARAVKPTRKARAKMGRPSTRGTTVPVAFRMSEELSKRVEKVRARAVKNLTRTGALEQLIRAGLEREEEAARKSSL